MKREAQPVLSVGGQQTLDQDAYALKYMESLSTVTTLNSLDDLRQLIAWCVYCRHEDKNEVFFTPQAGALPLLIHCWTILQAPLRLKHFTVNRMLIPKGATSLRYPSHRRKSDLVVTGYGFGFLRDRTITTLLLHFGLGGRELYTLIHYQAHMSMRNKVRYILHITVRYLSGMYLEMHPKESTYPIPIGKMQERIRKRALRQKITAYAGWLCMVKVSPHNLRNRLGHHIAAIVFLHIPVRIMRHDLLYTIMLYLHGARQDSRFDREKSA